MILSMMESQKMNEHLQVSHFMILQTAHMIFFLTLKMEMTIRRDLKNA